MTARPQAAAALVSLQRHYAGSVTRLAAFAIDLAVSYGLFAITLAAISWTAMVVTGHSVTWHTHDLITGIALVAGSVVIYAWDARAARLRFLAREPLPSAGPDGTAGRQAATIPRG